MVNVLVAIPRTPLFSRLEKEGRLDNGGELANFGTVSTNVKPARMSHEALCEGYLGLLRDLYKPDAYFARLDAQYLDGTPRRALGRELYLRRQFRPRLKKRAIQAIEGAYVTVQLMRGVPDRSLRRVYRRQLWNVVRRRPNVALFRFYAIKCALHFHFDRLIAQMTAERAALVGNPRIGRTSPSLSPESDRSNDRAA